MSVFILTRVLSDSPGPLYQVMSHGLASHFGMQGGSTQLRSTQLNSTQLNSTQLVDIAPTPQTRSASHLTHANPRGASGAARELVLFDSDVMMTLHHVVTMALSALVWYGDQSFAGG